MAKSRNAQLQAFSARRNSWRARLLEVWLTLKGVVWWLLRGLYRAWSLNPISLLRHRMQTLYKVNDESDLPIKPTWLEYVKDIFTSDVQRQIRLLQWVRSRVDHVIVDDFIFSWQDGIALCALLESVCPGVCPRYRLLKSDLRVNNCRFALQVAHKYLGIQRTILTPEEMAIADQNTEIKIVHLVQMIRWKHQRVPRSAPLEAHAVTLPVRRVINRCFARGAGLKSGMVGRRTKFNIFTDTNGVMDVLVEVRGPHGEMNSEKITSLNPADSTQPETDDTKPKHQSLKRLKVIADNHGNTFMRQKSFDEDSNEVIPFDYQSVGEGRFLVSYIPRNTGIHTVIIKSHDHHIQGSPFEVLIKSWASSWNIVGKSKTLLLPAIEEVPSRNKRLQDAVSKRFLQAGSARARKVKVDHTSNLTVSKRRVVKRVLTRNGEEISLSDYTPSPTLSRQSSADYSDASEEDHLKWDGKFPRSAKDAPRSGDKTYGVQLITNDICIPRDDTSNDGCTSDSLSAMSDTHSVASDAILNSNNGVTQRTAASLVNLKRSPKDGRIHPRTRGQTLRLQQMQRSLSDSFAVDVDVMDEKSKDESIVPSPHAETKPTSLKILQSGSLKKQCVYNNNNTILEDVELISPFDDGRSVRRRLSIRPKPSLAQIQKITRRWQSTDDSDSLSSSERKPATSPQTYVSTPKPSGRDEIFVKNESNSKSSENTGREVTERSDTNRKLTGTSFRCIFEEDHLSDTKTSKHVAIVVPKVKVNKTTQVCPSDIKDATGWHSGAFIIRKRRICLNRDNLNDNANQSNGITSAECGPSMPNKEEADEILQNRRHLGDHGDRRLNSDYNVEQWLKENGNNRCLVLEERQSTVETSDSGIADENSRQGKSIAENLHVQNTESSPFKNEGGIEMERPESNPSYSVSQTDMQKIGNESEQINFSDSELVYSTNRKLSMERERNCVRRPVDQGQGHLCHMVNSSEKITEGDISVSGSMNGCLEVAGNPENEQKPPTDDVTIGCEDLARNNGDSERMPSFPTSDISGNDSCSADLLSDRNFATQALQTMLDMLESNPFTETSDCFGDFENQEPCTAFGAGLSYGHVGIKNNFQVWVRYPGNGSVSVSVFGPKPHCVIETTTIYTGDNLYEVMYEVTHPGYYVISVKWRDESIPNSPFISKVAWEV